MGLIVVALLYVVWRKITSTKGISAYQGVDELEAQPSSSTPPKGP